MAGFFLYRAKRPGMLRYHEIAETHHRILNPFSEAKLGLLGEVCRLQPGQRHLDLCCGKGEMLCQWGRRWGTRGVGVDFSKVFLGAARARATELAVEVEFIEADAVHYVGEGHDIVSCIGATWIGGGLAGTLRHMRRSLAPGGLLLVGEPWWKEGPPGDDEGFTSLLGTLDRIESEGLELVEMVQADEDSWDRYVAAQWWACREWLEQHEDPELQAWVSQSRRQYLDYERRCLGWGVFVLKVARSNPK